MVHSMVKVVNIEYAPSTSLIVTNFDASITGDELDSAVQFRTSGWLRHGTKLALFIHGIISAKRRRELLPAILVGESSTQLLMYSLDTGIRYSTYLPIFKSQKGSIEALNFLIIIS